MLHLSNRKQNLVTQPSTFMIQSQPNILALTTTVSELLDGEMLGWNHALVNQIFSSEEVKLILSIPLSGTRQDDVIWRGTAKGVFSVWSAYHMQKEVEEVGQVESSYGGL
jgi:hypothetical protein